MTHPFRLIAIFKCINYTLTPGPQPLAPSPLKTTAKSLEKCCQQLLFSLALTLPLAIAAGCASNPTPPTVPATPESPAVSPVATGKQVAVLLSGPANDDSWNSAANKAVEALKAEGIDAVAAESVTEADAPRILRQYAEQGYRLVVAHGFQYRDAVFQVAKDYPRTHFAWAGGMNGTAENVADYEQPFYQGAYLVGLVAAELSKSGKMGALYGFDVPACHAMGQAMLAAAKTVKPSATLTSTAVGDWGDVAKAKEAALAQADTGVDYWIACGQGPALGAIEAVKQKKAGYTTGYVGNMSKLAPEAVATSIVWDMVPIFKQMLADIDAGTFARKYYRFGVPEGVIKVEVNPAFQDRLGADKMKSIQKAQEAIASGQMKVPFVPK